MLPLCEFGRVLARTATDNIWFRQHAGSLFVGGILLFWLMTLVPTKDAVAS
jgi:hypothetical protein